MTVAVEMTKGAKKDIDGLPAVVKARVLEVFTSLVNFPNVPNVKALKGDRKGTYRARVGGYRVFFTVAAGVLTVTGVSDRKDAY